MIEKIKERIAELEKERDEFIELAEKNVLAYNAAINELKKLLEPDPPTTEYKDEP